jgi:hypothetical protein
MKAGEIQQMPKSIVRAINSVQANVEAIAKSQFNKMGGYKFASADDIYAAITRKMGQVGLVIMPLELEPPKIERVEKEGKTSQWGRFRFGFMLACEDETWFDERSSRTLFIQLLGPQTFNAAESYAQKQFLRGLFKLPTGDMDLDSMPQDDTEEGQAKLIRMGPRKSSAEGKRDGSVKVFNELRAGIQSATEATSLIQYRKDKHETWTALPRQWSETLDEDYIAKMSTLGIDVDPENLDQFMEAAE